MLILIIYTRHMLVLSNTCIGLYDKELEYLHIPSTALYNFIHSYI